MECSKTGKGGACDLCAKKHIRCNLTEAVQAHWKAIGNPRGQSCSCSIGPQAKSRASSVAGTTGKQRKWSARGSVAPQSGEETEEGKSEYSLLH